MPVFTQTIADPEVTQIPAFIDARFPGQERLMETAWNNKVSRLEMPGLTQVQFDQLVLDLTAAFPNAMTADNDFDIPIIIGDAAAITWVAMPAALTEFNGITVHRVRAHLGNRTQAQLIANVQTPGVAGSGLRVQASLNNGATWRALDVSPGIGPQVLIDTAGVNSSSVVTIDALVRKDVLLRVVGGGGNGIISPAFGTIYMRIR